MTLPDGRKVIAFDFDGVLHEYHGWNEGTLDGPIPGMLVLVDDLRAAGCHVVVHTTREQALVQRWLTEHGFPLLDVYNQKWSRIDVFVDDRAFEFTPELLKDPARLLVRLMTFQPHWRRGHDHPAR